LTDGPDPRTALVTRAVDAPSVWDDLRLQKLWLGVEKKEWRSLAVVGAGGHVDTLGIAEVFAQLAWRYRGQPSTVCDLRDLSMRLVDYQVQEMRSQVESGMRLVIALRSIFENPTSAAIAQQADATVLCIALGETGLRGAEETIEAIGRERVVGSVLLRARGQNRDRYTNGR
jgi:hypothetical protein